MLATLVRQHTNAQAPRKLAGLTLPDVDQARVSWKLP